MNEIKTLYLRCPECGLALFKAKDIQELPIGTDYRCYGCDNDIHFTKDDVDIKSDQNLIL